MKEVIVIGAGFAGSVIARILAEKGCSVTILEKRDHIGGNMYDFYDNSGVLIHKYGPHIFHTNSESAFNFIKPFSEWSLYEHKVLGNIDGKNVPVPFNLKSLELLFEAERANNIKHKLEESYKDNTRVSILDLINSKDADIKDFGDFVYEKVFATYTAKQWGIPVEEIDKSVINRVPVLLNYDERYFQDAIQFMPKNGFTKLFEGLLEHENITIKTSVDALEVLKYDSNNNTFYYNGSVYTNPIVYTGAIDELFDCVYGRLPYRSLNLKFETYDKTEFQEAAVVNYNTSEEFTRITEFKKLTGQILENKTTVLKEFPGQYDHTSSDFAVPYYPIIEEQNLSLYNKYKTLAGKVSNLYLCGRLADYSYYNMDAVIDRAIKVAESIEC
jgi:UDP-galactopyranose mutase